MRNQNGNCPLPWITCQVSRPSSKELRSICEGKITYNECFSVLQSFQKNKIIGNDGLTVRFYLAFWPLIGKYPVDCINDV